MNTQGKAAGMQNRSLAPVRRDTRCGLDVVAVPRRSCEELFLTARLQEGQTPEEMFAALGEALGQRGAQVVSVEVFGLDDPRTNGGRCALEAYLPEGWPIQWCIDAAGRTPPLSGVLVHAIAGTDVACVRHGGRIVGASWSDGFGRYVRLSDIRPPDASMDRPAQARAVFEAMEQALASEGMTFLDVARTWFYNEDILGWYDEFNSVRTRYFQEHGVFDALVPASTGIGAVNSSGSALVAGLIAVQTDNPADVDVKGVESPLQSSARDYGSSFSRAAIIETPDARRLFVSGTASIDRAGKTVHLDDIDAQIDLTMRVIRAILQARGMDWKDVVRSLVYLRKGGDLNAWIRYRDANGLGEMPAVITETIVCRDDLLFEVEVTAMQATG
jgi:enamine deaminase RidA (YjgF/YER057c/UK114 family)